MLPDLLLSEGRFWFTTAEAEALLQRNRRALYPRIAELEHAGKLFSPAQGFYVVVPPEYRDWKVIPADWFIDPLMRHLRRDYYVSFLAAAARHGAAHQAPQTFQVIVDRHLRDRDLGRVRLRFTTSSHLPSMTVEKATSHTGTYALASRETTAVDLTWRPRAGGGVSNVATILRDLGQLDSQQIARLAAVRGRPVARRLGWLVQRFRPDLDPYWLREVARPSEGVAALLVPGNRRQGSIDREWGLQLNGTVEPD
jgi:predicted transcriptional regulator of viral defense system